jgi:hypothetical protein
LRRERRREERRGEEERSAKPCCIWAADLEKKFRSIFLSFLLLLISAVVVYDIDFR